MLAQRPFVSTAALHAAADAAMAQLGREDHLEAFAQHPAIGEGAAELARRFAHTASWSAAEQAGTQGADAATLTALHDANLAYAKRFGFTFIVCASGKSAGELLQALQARLSNPPELELTIAAAQQLQITHLRLEKLAP